MFQTFGPYVSNIPPLGFKHSAMSLLGHFNYDKEEPLAKKVKNPYIQRLYKYIIASPKNIYPTTCHFSYVKCHFSTLTMDFRKLM